MEPSGRERHDGTNIHAYDGNNLMRVCVRNLSPVHQRDVKVQSVVALAG